MTPDPAESLLALFETALQAADPAAAVQASLPERPAGPVIVVGVGKAASAMASGVEQSWGTDLSGTVITRDGYGTSTRAITVVEAAHPIPDERGGEATKAIMSLVQNAPSDALIVGLWSGGGSSLLVQPVTGLALSDKQFITDALVSSGLSIHQINTVRKHLSAIKGGRLALLAGDTPMHNVFVSDVAGDDLSVIASGPTVADPTTCEDALDILEHTGIDVPAPIIEMLHDGRLETPKTIQHTVTNQLILSPKDVLSAVERHAKALGLAVVNVGDYVEGEAKSLAASFGQQALEAVGSIEQPTVILSGGEATVTLDQRGKGGPNLEFCMAMAITLNAHPQVWALSCDTDGTDGVSSSAGAIVTPDTLTRAREHGRDPDVDLRNHNSELFFHAVDGLISPGPTGTNVNDFRAILILPSS